jgi:Glycosyltransferase sugar-binding region containing DXD motif
MPIRRDFHFIFGLKPQTEPLHLAFYLALESCRRVNTPDHIHFHYRNEPYGEYWERIKPFLTLHRVSGTRQLDASRYADTQDGRFVLHYGLQYAHEADVLRLEILRDAGGCYADMDSLFVRRYPDELFALPFAIGEENGVVNTKGTLEPSLCNAVMFATPGAPFAERWLTETPKRFDGSWSAHSCQAAAELARELPREVTLLPRGWFYRFGASKAGLSALFEERAALPHDLLSIHLWAHLWWTRERTEYSTFHAGLLDEAYVRRGESTYAALARPWIDA